jgi:hypothetical protein
MNPSATAPSSGLEMTISNRKQAPIVAMSVMTTASPERDGDRPRVVIAARLCEVASGGDAELERESLEEDRDEIRDEDDREQRVAEPCAAGDVGGPVARVHVAHGDEISGPGEREHLAPPAEAVHRDGAVGLGEGGGGARAAPAGDRRWRRYVGRRCGGWRLGDGQMLCVGETIS